MAEIKRPLYRLEFMLPITNERQLWSNYLDRSEAQEKAYDLVASDRAAAAEVFAVESGRKTSIYHARKAADGAILVRRTEQQ